MSRTYLSALTAALGLTLLLAIAGGCRSEGALPGQTVTGSRVTVESDEQFVVLSHQLDGKLSFHDPISRRVDNGRLQVVVNIRNRTNFTQNIDVSTTFRDKDNVPLNDDSAWQRLVLGANETRAYQVSSVTDKACTFTVRVREGR